MAGNFIIPYLQKGWEHGSMVECLSSMHKALGSVTNTLKTEKDLSVAFATGGYV